MVGVCVGVAVIVAIVGVGVVVVVVVVCVCVSYISAYFQFWEMFCGLREMVALSF